MRKLIIAIKLYTSSPSCSVKNGWGILVSQIAQITQIFYSAVDYLPQIAQIYADFLFRGFFLKNIRNLYTNIRKYRFLQKNYLNYKNILVENT